MTDDKSTQEPAPDERESKSAQQGETTPQPPPPQPYTRRPIADEPPVTISLFDLMQADDGGDSTPTTPPQPSELPPLTSSTSKPKTTPPDDPTATITSAPAPKVPQQTDTTKKTPQPLTADQLRPPSTIPPQFDPDATVVQPRVAFPGNQQTTQKAAPQQAAPTCASNRSRAQRSPAGTTATASDHHPTRYSHPAQSARRRAAPSHHRPSPGPPRRPAVAARGALRSFWWG